MPSGKSPRPGNRIEYCSRGFHAPVSHGSCQAGRSGVAVASNPGQLAGTVRGVMTNVNLTKYFIYVQVCVDDVPTVNK